MNRTLIVTLNRTLRELPDMPNNSPKNESRVDTLKNEATRQRWDLFHRAIAHAKQCNVSALEDASGSDERRTAPLQSIAG